MDEDLGRAALEFENVRHGVRDGCGEAAAFLEGATPGNVHGDKRHEILLSRPPL
jgi:hypothetical protein